jgi:hypothetical protein
LDGYCLKQISIINEDDAAELLNPIINEDDIEELLEMCQDSKKTKHTKSKPKKDFINV